jgi:hypothetical protein
MKWFILFSTTLTLFFHRAAAQQSDIAQIVVHYKFSHLRDTNNRANPYTNDMALKAGKSASVYKSSITKGFKAGGPEYYQFPHEKKLVRKEPIFTVDFLLNEALPVIKWQITHDTASFGGLHCQKATTHFRGRDYTAWFCPDLPLPVGPWKLNGLPGIIIEACDAKKEVCFIFDGIEKVGTSADPAVIKVPANATATTEKEFTRLQETFRKDPEAFMRMVAGAGDGSGRQLHIDIKPGPPPVMNNPIELTEKQ